MIYRHLIHFVLYGLIIFSWPVYAAEKTPSENLTQLRQQSQALADEISADRKKQAKLQNELREQDLAIANINKKLKDLDNKNVALTQQLKSQEEKAKKLDADIKERQAYLAKSIRALHASGQLPDFKLLFNQENPGEWLRLSTFYGYFNEALETEIKTLHQQLSEQEQLRDSIQATQAQLASQREEVVKEQQSLQKQKNIRKNVLTKLQHGINNKDKQLQELRASEAELQRVINTISQPNFTQNYPPAHAGNFAQYQGKLAWPTVGKITHTFGSPRKGGQQYDGIVISAPAGQAVKAVFSGRVLFADWLRGYGVLLIIDHGNQYVSLYAHNDSLFKKVGDKVKAGEQIATVGTTGGLSSPALYFEIRKNGKPVNPQKWLMSK